MDPERITFINVSFPIQNKGMPRLSNPVARQPELFMVLDERDVFFTNGILNEDKAGIILTFVGLGRMYQ